MSNKYMEGIPLQPDHPDIPLMIREAVSKMLAEIECPNSGVVFCVESDKGVEWWLFVDDELVECFWVESE